MKKLLIVLSFLISYSLAAQVDLGYQKPSKAILDLVDVPLPPRMTLNSKGDKALLLYRNSFKTIEELSSNFKFNDAVIRNLILQKKTAITGKSSILTDDDEENNKTDSVPEKSKLSADKDALNKTGAKDV